MGYFYRVYNEDEKKWDEFVPDNFDIDVQNELLYFDYFASISKSQEGLIKRIGVSNRYYKKVNISDIRIGLSNAGDGFVAYKPVYENKYIEKLFEVKNGKFLNIRANKLTPEERKQLKEDPKCGIRVLNRMTIEPDCNVYKEMIQYLFETLKNSDLSNVYFKNIFSKKRTSKGKNGIRNLLNEYSKTYLFNEHTTEDIKHLEYLEEAIKEKLKHYEFFRVVAITRYDYEKEMADKGAWMVMQKEIELTEEEKRKLKAKIKRAEKKRVKEAYENKPDNNMDEYKQEYDEYLSPDEYNEMSNGEGNKVYISRR